MKSKHLPITREEMFARGWDQLDILLVTGDAYIDHPSFGVPLLGRWLESLGFRVGILPQPRWDSPADFMRMGTPRLFIGISSGVVDSMLNNYTANKRKRSDDDYSPGRKGGMRPDRAVWVYSRLAREAFPNAIIVAGGVEASLRRLAHYDYWDNKVKPSILWEAPLDYLLFGMAEKTLADFARILKEAADEANAEFLTRQTESYLRRKKDICSLRGIAFVTTREESRKLEPRLVLPMWDEVRDDKKKYLKTARFIEQEANPYCGRILVQDMNKKYAVVVNPPQLPLTTAEFDALYDLPFTRLPHPVYKEPIPAAEMIKFSLCITRGCPGGCAFCAIYLHQGKFIQSRSQESIVREIKNLSKLKGFTGYISDLGGPTANSWGQSCSHAEAYKVCRRPSCLFPSVCTNFSCNHKPLIELMRCVRNLPEVKKVVISSGVRYDMAFADSEHGLEYLRELIMHHVGGHLKIAPEHLDMRVLELMRKPSTELFYKFLDFFKQVSKSAGKEQYVVPYFISSYPGSTPESMEVVCNFLTKQRWNLQQVQDFIPTPMTMASAMYWAEMDMSGTEKIFVAKSRNERLLQQRLLQPHHAKFKVISRRHRGEGKLHGR